MCDRSRWKPRAYCYATKKIKSVSTTKWERQIPKEKEYWYDFCRKEESKVIVRNSYKNFLYFNLDHKYPRDLYSKDFENVEERTVDDKIANFGSPSTPTILNKMDGTDKTVLPVISVLSSTPPGSSNGALAPREIEFVDVEGKIVVSEREYSPGLSRNDQNFVGDLTRNRGTYTSGNCPLHRGEPPPRIFDDDIERYLTDSGRFEHAKAVEEERIDRGRDKMLSKKVCRICRKSIVDATSNFDENITDPRISERNEVKNKALSKLIANQTNGNDSSNYPNSNGEGTTSVSRMASLNDAKNERDLTTSLLDRVDDIESSDHTNDEWKGATLVSEIYRIPKLNDVDSKDSWNKLTLDRENRNLLVAAGPREFRSKGRRKCFDLPKFKLPKFDQKRGSSIKEDFDKYFVKYARKALKRVTRDQNLCYQPRIYEKVSLNVERGKNGSSKEASKCSGSAWSLDLELGGDYKRHETSLDHFLNRLPKLSYFPRRCRDRCLACLHRSVDDIVESERVERRKGRGSMAKSSIESDDSEVTLPELVDDPVLIDEIEVDDKEKLRSIEDSMLGEKETKFRRSPRIQEKPEESRICEKSKLESSDDKRLEVKAISITSEKSKISSSRSSSDEEKSCVLFDDNTKNSRYRVACHAPTTLRPSLEPLRALRTKKSTSLEARIASNESTTVIASLEDGKNVKSRTEVKERKLEVKKDSKKEEDSVTVKKVLTKVRSMGDNLIDGSENLTRKKRREMLRRGSSCVDLETILQNFSNDVQLESLMEDDDARETSTMGRFFSREEIEKVLKDLEERDSSSLEALRTLCDLFLKRIVEIGNVDKKRMRLIERLVRLLIDSRRYAKPEKYSLEVASLTPSSEFFVQRPFLNAERLRAILPLASYNLIAPLLGMPEHHIRVSFSGTKDIHPVPLPMAQRSDKSDSLPETGDDLVVLAPSLKVESIKQEDLDTEKLNPYALFLKKERRKVVTWRPLTDEDLSGYDPEATLRMRADKVTTRICKDFCKWLRSLGGAERDVDETVLKDMFEISFSADACKATQINVKEMATVPTDVAAARLCQGSSVLAMTKKQVHRDVKAENETKRCLAFNTFLPIDLLFIPPNNHVQERWLECKNVPQDLETMDVVWNGIADLESVKGFLLAFRRYPEVNPPEILMQAKPSKRTRGKKSAENKNA